jgi:multidrug resistance protein
MDSPADDPYGRRPHASWQTIRSTNTWSTNDTYSMMDNRPISDLERARLRPLSTEEFPWISREVDTDNPSFAPIRAASTRKPPAWFQEAREEGASTELSRGNSTRSHNTARESIVDLAYLVSDLDFYAGAVHDFGHDALSPDSWTAQEEQDWPLPEDSDGATFGQISILRNKSNAKSMNRKPSTRSRRSEKDTSLVTWDGPGDPTNPKNWSRQRKWAATITVSLFTFISPVSSSMIAPALFDIATEFGEDPNSGTIPLALSVFVLGFAVGPLFIGPMSELFGRRIVLQISNLFYFAFNLGCGFAQNTPQLIAFRFLSGLGGSAPLGIGGGVLGDLWMPQERGRAMALYSLMPLLGPAIGPIAGGFIAEYSDWRWVFYSTCIAAIVIQIMGFFFLQETYAAEILRVKKVRLIKATGDPTLHTEFETPNRKLSKHLGAAFERPFRLLFTQPIVQILALYIGYVYGVMYLVLASFPMLWRTQYGIRRPSISGLNYISLGVGFFIGTQIAAFSADKIYKNLKAKHGGVGRSEFRVPLMVPGSLLVPIGLFIYGWTAQEHTHWIGPNIGAAIFAAGNQMVFQCCQTYIVDAYTRYAASAIAATTVLRSLGGFAFPLFASAMYRGLGYGWGNSVLGFVGLAIGFPAPILLWWYGETLRKKSQFAAG